MKMNKIFDYLDSLFPNPVCELEYNKDYELLIAIVLSAQTTDKRVNKVTRVLFSKYKTIEELANADVSDIENIIREIGTYKRKSMYVKEIANYLYKNNIKKIPNDRKLIESLPGAGHKTANVFLGVIYNEAVIAVDTHVLRASKRLGLVSLNDDVKKVEQKLIKKVPKDKRNKFHHQLVLFGRYQCKAIKPLCNDCRLKQNCKYYSSIVMADTGHDSQASLTRSSLSSGTVSTTASAKPSSLKSKIS